MRRRFTTGVNMSLSTKVSSKPETNLTFLTYLVGRLDLNLFSVYWGGMRWATSFRFEDNHTTSASPLTRGLQRGIVLHAYLSPISPDRREGYLLSTTHSALALFKVHRGLGCDGWDSNPRFPAYEAGDLAASLPRNMNYFSHFGIYIIP